MSLTADDLLQATGGELDGATLFPALSADALGDMLGVWLTEGYTKAAAVTDTTAQDEAAAAWAYAQAYRAVAQRLAATSSTRSLNDQGSATIGAAQIAFFQNLAADKLARFGVLVPVTSVDRSPRILSSQAQAASFEW